MNKQRSYGSVVETHLTAMEGTQVVDQPSAHIALGHALAAVASINYPPGQGGSQSLAGPVADVAELLQTWLKRLLDKLTEIVKTLAHGTTFSLSVGPGVSVTINFPEMD
ncbi:MAG: hypothetical protein ACYDC5_09390 [Candidatus Dormibacteria bacterium]